MITIYKKQINYFVSLQTLKGEKYIADHHWDNKLGHNDNNYSKNKYYACVIFTLCACLHVYVGKSI